LFTRHALVRLNLAAKVRKAVQQRSCAGNTRSFRQVAQGWDGPFAQRINEKIFDGGEASNFLGCDLLAEGTGQVRESKSDVAIIDVS
jgi:hypothetical protein